MRIQNSRDSLLLDKKSSTFFLLLVNDFFFFLIVFLFQKYTIQCKFLVYHESLIKGKNVSSLPEIVYSILKFDI